MNDWVVPFTDHERAILQCLLDGVPAAEIEEKTNLSRHQLRQRIHDLANKLKLYGRVV